MARYARGACSVPQVVAGPEQGGASGSTVTKVEINEGTALLALLVHGH